MPGFKQIKDYYTSYSLFTKEKGKVNLNSNKTNLDKASPKKGRHLLLPRGDGGEGENKTYKHYHSLLPYINHEILRKRGSDGRVIWIVSYHRTSCHYSVCDLGVDFQLQPDSKKKEIS